MFNLIIKNILFKRKIGTLIALIFLVLSFVIEYKNQNSPLAQNIFSASGSIFTIVGLFLSIKASTIFHLNNPRDKYTKIEGKEIRMSDSGHPNEKEMEKHIQPIEDDEIWGFSLIVIGTLIWGYGSYAFIILSNITNCVISNL